MLKTLPQREIKSGLGEIIKHALIADAKMFDLISRESKNILNLNSNILSDLIYENIKIKSKIVEADEKELNERRKLNLGHTLGHALEKHINISHGEAVVMGIVFAAKVSFRLNYISQTDLDKIIQTLRLFDFEISCSVNKEKLIDAMIYDKKRKGDKIAFVILEKIGQAKIENIKLSTVKQWIYDLC
jgi:3-dehydroquinate synthase